MATVDMKLVKELREKTHVGLMDCKKALVEADGNIDKAIELLRKRGAAVAAKRSGQETNEGVVAAFINDDNTVGSLVEVGCETDFAANTEAMRSFASDTAEHVAKEGVAPDKIDALMASASKDGLTVEEILNSLVAKISEKIKVANFARFVVSGNGLVQAYIHPGSRLGTLILISTDKDPSEKREELARVARDLCMQIAVTDPLCVEPSQLDSADAEKERNLYREQFESSGKPAEIIEKIIDGKMRKYYEEVCLLNQRFIKEDKKTVQQFLDESAKNTGVKVSVDEYVRFKIGK